MTIDWELLRIQKLKLLELISDDPDSVLWGLVHLLDDIQDDKLHKIVEKHDFGKGLDIRLMFDEVIAPKELEDGREYPDSLVKRYEDFFDKI